jgi:hypothetical protein
MGNLVDLLLEESDFIPKYQIYCDMDGVLTDFEKRFVTLYNKKVRSTIQKQLLHK